MARSASRSRPWQRRSLGALLLLWLTSALQPCVMAMPSTAGSPADEPPHRCPHCPPKEKAQHAHAGHPQHQAMQGRAAAPCLESETSCSPLEEPFIDTRENSLRVHDLPDADELPAASFGDLTLQVALTSCPLPVAQSPPPTRSVRIHLLNCVLLQ